MLRIRSSSPKGPAEPDLQADPKPDRLRGSSRGVAHNFVHHEGGKLMGNARGMAMLLIIHVKARPCSRHRPFQLLSTVAFRRPKHHYGGELPTAKK